LSLSERWRLSASYTYLHMQLMLDPGVEPYFTTGVNPCNQVRLTSGWDLGSHWQFDTIFRYVDNLPDMDVPSYITMDLRLAWQPKKNFELAFIGRNLLDSHHPEFGQGGYPFVVTQVERSVFGKVTWRY
jgi:iron complex outermembrane recepter protein